MWDILENIKYKINLTLHIFRGKGKDSVVWEGGGREVAIPAC